MLGSVGIRGFELVARRPTDFAVPMEVARRRDVDGSKRRSVSQPSLVLSRERKRKGYTATARLRGVITSLLPVARWYGVTHAIA